MVFTTCPDGGKGLWRCREAGIPREDGLNNYWHNLQSELPWTEEGREKQRGGRWMANNNDPIDREPTLSQAGAMPTQASSQATVFHQWAPEAQEDQAGDFTRPSETRMAPLITKLHSVSERTVEPGVRHTDAAGEEGWTTNRLKDCERMCRGGAGWSDSQADSQACKKFSLEQAPPHPTPPHSHPTPIPALRVQVS